MAAFALAIAVAASPAAGCGSRGPVRIGVLLPLTGPEAVGAQGPLTWAQENINAAGGIDGRPVEFVYRDLGKEHAEAVARELASGSSVDAVIGPANSEDAKQVVSTFVNHHKVVVTPSATSADLFRAFYPQRPQYVWRPVESDIAQVRVMLRLAAQDKATSVALVTGTSPYGNTFFNSFGFLATEKGLRVAATIRYDQDAGDCEKPVDQALNSGAGVVLAVPDHAGQAICMAREWRARGSRPRLLFSDAGQAPALISALGRRAEGIEGTGLAPGIGNGFARAFPSRFHQPPTPYAANLYDSVLLIAYGLARSRGADGAALARAIAEIVHGAGPATGWDRPGVAAGLKAIRAGHPGAVHGAVGPWDFDRSSGLELVASTYAHWRVADGRFSAAGYVSTAGAGTAVEGESAFRTPATPGKGAHDMGGGFAPARAHTGTWALLLAGSDGWDNYRHQADVLAQYQRLRAGGVPAGHIIVVSPDDLARNRRNPRPGQVPYVVGGPSLHSGYHADYPLRGMTAGRFLAILSGHASPDTPKVIRSGPGDNVYVFMAGHGNQDGFYLGLGRAVPSANGSYSVLTPRRLDTALSGLANRHRYRRIVVAVEACQAGVFGEDLHAPGALLLAAANPYENSLGTNYDPRLRTWLADEFSYQLWRAQGSMAGGSVYQLYQRLYAGVSGSHVSAYGPDFGNPATVPIREFAAP